MPRHDLHPGIALTILALLLLQLDFSGQVRTDDCTWTLGTSSPPRSFPFPLPQAQWIASRRATAAACHAEADSTFPMPQTRWNVP